MNSSEAPLPPGWEQRWDAATRRYFYIDHFNRKTSWFDPRTQQPGGAPPAMRNEQPDQGVELRRLDVPQPASRGQQYVKPTNAYDEYATDYDEDDDEATTSLVDDEYAFNVMLLKTKFPNLSESTIRDSLTRNNNNTTFATRDLVVIRERQSKKPTSSPLPPQQLAPPQQHSRQHERPSPPPSSSSSDNDERRRRLVDKISRDFPSAGIAIIDTVIDNVGVDEDEITEAMQSMGYQCQSTTRRLSSMQPSPGTVSERAETPRQQPAPLTDSDKSRRLLELKSKFSTLPERTVAIALQCCNYDVNIASRILENDIETAKQRSMAAQESSAASSVAQPSSQPPRPETAAQPKPVESRRSSGDLKEAQTTQSEPAPVPALQPSRPESRKSTSSTKRESTRTTPIDTSPAAPAARTPASRSSLAKGPNLALRSGPNSSLSQGPNGAYAKGAMVGLAKGPSSDHLKSRVEPRGHDSSLVRGPQALSRMAAATA